MNQIPASLLTLVIGVVVTLFSIWIGQHHGLLPEQASAQAPLVDGLFNLMVGIGAALFLVVEGAIIWFVIRYRRRAGDDTDGVPVEGNLPLEAFWTAIPAIIVIGLSIYSVDVFQQMGERHPAVMACIMLRRWVQMGLWPLCPSPVLGILKKFLSLAMVPPRTSWVSPLIWW
jgi:cytochrome c oxidase subunit 2